MRKMINEVHIEGRVYDFKLEKKMTGENSKVPGTEYISGTIDVATDEACQNVVQIHYTYATSMTSKGKPSSTYLALENLIDAGSTVIKDGKDAATKVRWDGAIDLNEFSVERDGKEEWVSAKRNEGGFFHVMGNEDLNEDETKRATWKTDMVITNVTEVEADPEKDLPAKGVVKGYIFNFRKEVMPVEFVTHNTKAIAYFMGLEASQKHPVFTGVWGREVSQTIITRTVTESAFGEDSVTERKSSRKEFLITGTSKIPYEWDDEQTITAIEMKEALANREVMLAEKKKQRAEYDASRANKTITATAGSYNF